jgi:glycosyltransferase involved in cell wall biosynthesis
LLAEAHVRTQSTQIAVVIPCYRVAKHIAQVIRGIPSWIETIVCVDDCSPDDSVTLIEQLNDPRVIIVRHAKNQGVGGALITGYRECLRLGVDIVVKMDGDDQMDPAALPALLDPLLRATADYAKGNRWADPEQLVQMPSLRRWGNLGLSFAVKVCSGYWNVFDPCNGYTAIRASVLQKIRFDRLAHDYFFETSMLLQLNLLGAVVCDVPIPARYGDEKSSLRIGRVLRRFPWALLKGLRYRIWQRHFVRDFGPFAMFLVFGLMLTTWGVVFGGYHWWRSYQTDIPTTAGTVMLAAMPFLMGFQLLLQAVVLDMGQKDAAPLCHDEPLPYPTALDSLRRIAA